MASSLRAITACPRASEDMSHICIMLCSLLLQLTLQL
jgi:hypothetical protein